MIQLTNVYKSFDSFEVLKNINLTISEGEIHGIVGQSGAGKSTVLRLINKLEQPDRGEVNVAGQLLHQLSGSELRKARQSMGMIFQHFNLLANKTVADNVGLTLQLIHKSKSECHNRVNECLNFVGLTEHAKKYPAQLSGGQKQRVAIARALANNPKVLLCDEPTSALDSGTTVEILEVLKRINEQLGLTIVIVSHELEVIKSICNRVTVMQAGEIVETFSIKPTGINRTVSSAEDMIRLLKKGDS